ncbi:MAG: ribosome maturation factor RimM [Bacteriovoracaceae bacterium]
MTKQDRLIQLGSCSKPHGIRGGFGAHLFNPKDSSLKKGAALLLKPKNDHSSLAKSGKVFELKSANFGNKCILYFEGIETREQVESMIPFDMFIERSALPEPDEDEFYIEDLIGLKVLDEEGNEVGVVRDHFDNGAQIVLSVQKNAEVVELPLVEEFFPEINMEQGFIKMIEPEII